VVSRDGVQDEVEAARVLLHLVRVTGEDDLSGAEAEGILLLGLRGGEDDDVGAERLRQPDTHVAQPAKAVGSRRTISVGARGEVLVKAAKALALYIGCFSLVVASYMEA
jgi:hypothetical protein